MKYFMLAQPTPARPTIDFEKKVGATVSTELCACHTTAKKKKKTALPALSRTVVDPGAMVIKHEHAAVHHQHHHGKLTLPLFVLFGCRGERERGGEPLAVAAVMSTLGAVGVALAAPVRRRDVAAAGLDVLTALQHLAWRFLQNCAIIIITIIIFKII